VSATPGTLPGSPTGAAANVALLASSCENVGAWGVYYPQCEYSQEPARSDEGGLSSATLAFRARENQDSPGGLTGDNLEKFRSPFHILIVA